MSVVIGQEVVISKPREGFEWLRGIKSKVLEISKGDNTAIPPVVLENEYYVYEDEIEPIK